MIEKSSSTSMKGYCEMMLEKLGNFPKKVAINSLSTLHNLQPLSSTVFAVLVLLTVQLLAFHPPIVNCHLYMS